MENFELESLKGLPFSISASTEATKMYHLSNSSFLRDQSIDAVFVFIKGMFHAVFIEKVK